MSHAPLHFEEVVSSPTGPALGVRYLEDMLNIAVILRRWRHSRRYLSVFGRYPHWVRPSSFTEKVHVRKLFDRRPEMGIFCDKLASRDYAIQRAPELSLIPLLWTGDDPDAIPFETLEPPYVVKPSSGCFRVRFVTDRASTDFDEIRRECREWMAGPPHGRRYGEWGYGQVPRHIMVERMLQTETGGSPSDWKVFVFGGRARVVLRSGGRYFEGTRSFLNTDGSLLPWELWWKDGRWKFHGDAHDRDEVQEVVRQAEMVARDMDFLRVDLYRHGGKIWLGELTAYPFSGLNAPVLKGTTDINPVSRLADDILGAHWEMPEWSLAERTLRALFA